MGRPPFVGARRCPPHLGDRMDVMRQDLTGLVLAGGRSRRMGTDKALLPVDGRPLVCNVAARLAAHCPTVLVASGRRRLLQVVWPQVDDRVPGAGPLAGILGGLAAATTPLVAVVAVDMPCPDTDVLRRLANAWSGHAAVVPTHDGRPQPLHAVYATSALRPLAAAFDAGERSPTRALARVKTLMLPVRATRRWSLDLDTREDLARFHAQNR
jgi:molybdopterin-guanine dinucleotide biosynthesis protein A